MNHHEYVCRDFIRVVGQVEHPSELSKVFVVMLGFHLSMWRRYLLDKKGGGGYGG